MAARNIDIRGEIECSNDSHTAICEVEGPLTHQQAHDLLMALGAAAEAFLVKLANDQGRPISVDGRPVAMPLVQ